jgi:hypothetical protein
MVIPHRSALTIVKVHRRKVSGRKHPDLASGLIGDARRLYILGVPIITPVRHALVELSQHFGQLTDT